MTCSMKYDFQIKPDLESTIHAHRIVVEPKYLEEEIELILLGLKTSIQMHSGQLRSDDNPYAIHPIRVALLIEEYESASDINIHIAALLHDALEDTELREIDVLHTFGPNILNLLVDITRYRLPTETPAQRRLGKLRKWKSAMSKTRPVRVLKTFDYLDNMISWKFISRDHSHFSKIPRWLMEAKTMYLPLARSTSSVAYKLMTDEFEFYMEAGFDVGDWYSDTP